MVSPPKVLTVPICVFIKCGSQWASLGKTSPFIVWELRERSLSTQSFVADSSDSWPISGFQVQLMATKRALVNPAQLLLLHKVFHIDWVVLETGWMTLEAWFWTFVSRCWRPLHVFGGYLAGPEQLLIKCHEALRQFCTLPQTPWGMDSSIPHTSSIQWMGWEIQRKGVLCCEWIHFASLQCSRKFRRTKVDGFTGLPWKNKNYSTGFLVFFQRPYGSARMEKDMETDNLQVWSQDRNCEEEERECS